MSALENIHYGFEHHLKWLSPQIVHYTLGGPQHAYTLFITHKGMRSSTQTCQILQIKGLKCKRLLLCRLHEYKNAYMS